MTGVNVPQILKMNPENRFVGLTFWSKPVFILRKFIVLVVFFFACDFFF